MSQTDFDIEKYASEFAEQSPRILIDIASKIRPDIKVFCLDTGRLHAETYRFIDRVREHYGINIDVLFPDSDAVRQLVKNKGLFSFYHDGHQECCGIRKVLPLKRKLTTLDAWITGQRRDQSPDTRNNVPVIQKDNAFSTADKTLVKFNPLANWSSDKVWEYIRGNDVPYNEDISVLVVNRAHARCFPANMNAWGAGGGKKRPARNVDFTRPT